MADSTVSETNTLSLSLLVLAVIALIPGLVIHSFILDVNDWWKARSMTSSIDHIISSLGISRLCTHCALTLNVLVNIFFQSSLNSHVTLIIIEAFHIFFTYSNIWLTTLLTIVFCLKISNLRTRLFLYLRRMILPRTGHFIVVSGLLSAALCLITHTEVTDGGTYNTTTDNLNKDCRYVNAIYSFSIGASISLLCSFTSSILLFSSLYQHTVKMKMSSNLSINLETYYSAMKFVSFTFIYNTTYLMGHFAFSLYYIFNCLNLIWFLIVLGLLPVLHSSYLIYRTAKLRSQMSKVLQIVIDVMFQRKVTETRENKEVIAH